MVTAVLNESPSSGVLEHGDVITSIDGQVVSSRKDVMDAVMASSVGDVISVILIRGDDILDLSVAVGETDISKRDIFRSRVAQMHKPNLTQGLIQQAFQAGDRFARGEVVIADENGVYQTYRATAGLVTEIDSDAKTFTLQPKDGSALIEYMISDDAKVNLNRTGDLGELNTEANTLVVDVNGEVKQVHQGEMSKPYMQGKGHGPNIRCTEVRAGSRAESAGKDRVDIDKVGSSVSARALAISTSRDYRTRFATGCPSSVPIAVQETCLIFCLQRFW